jgi:hypothetical protein
LPKVSPKLNGPRLILSAGHWCPECVKDTARYARQAVANRFLAQVEDPTRVAEWRRRAGRVRIVEGTRPPSA